MTDNPHLGRWCVVDDEATEENGVWMHHIYCSFTHEHDARVASQDMNSFIRNDPRGKVRRRVKVLHYYFPQEELDV